MNRRTAHPCAERGCALLTTRTRCPLHARRRATRPRRQHAGAQQLALGDCGSVPAGRRRPAAGRCRRGGAGEGASNLQDSSPRSALLGVACAKVSRGR